MFGLGETELVIIVVFGFLLFGPDKLPGMGRTIGRALRQFREAQEGFTQVVQTEVMDPLNDAMNAPTKKRAAAQGIDDDSDIEGSDRELSAQRSETFAERRERLRREREAREAAERASSEPAVAQDAGAEAPVSDASCEVAPTEQGGGTAPQGAPEQADEACAPAPKSAADLYALTPLRPAREAGGEPGTASGIGEAPEGEVTPGSDPGAPAPATGEGLAAGLQVADADGKEDGALA